MALPVAAIVSIVFGAWALLVLILFAVYQVLKTRGTCSCECAPCGKESNGQCSDCCISLSESCDCDCCKPSSESCLDNICPKNKKISCVDIILCQCCGEPSDEPCCAKLCPCCESSNGCCSCDLCRECESIKCCCLEVRLVSKTDSIRDSRPSNMASARAQTASSTSKDQNVIKSAGELSPPLTPATARSTSHVKLLSSKNSFDKSKPVLNKEKRAPLTKAAKSETAVEDKQKNEKVQRRQLSKSQSVPLPQRLPLKRQERIEDSITVDAKSKRREHKASELKEVAVENSSQSLPLHSYVFQSHVQNNYNLLYSHPAFSDTGIALGSSHGLSQLSSSFSSSGLQSSRPLPVPSTYS